VETRGKRRRGKAEAIRKTKETRGDLTAATNGRSFDQMGPGCPSTLGQSQEP